MLGAGEREGGTFKSRRMYIRCNGTIHGSIQLITFSYLQLHSLAFDIMEYTVHIGSLLIRPLEHPEHQIGPFLPYSPNP